MLVLLLVAGCVVLGDVDVGAVLLVDLLDEGGLLGVVLVEFEDAGLAEEGLDDVTPKARVPNPRQVRKDEDLVER